MSNEITRRFNIDTAKVKLLFDPGVVALNQAIELEERPPSQSLTLLIYALTGAIVAGILWSAITRVDIVANAPGRVAPVGDVVAIQHLEGGVVAQIAVGEGEHVKKGQVLLRMAALDNEGRLEQLKSKRAALLLAVEGQRALFEGREPKFDTIVPGFALQKAEQLALYNARMQEIRAQRTVLGAQETQRQREVERLSAQLIVLRNDEKSAQEELKLREDLFARKLTTRDRFYGAQRDAADRQKQRLNSRDQLARAESELAEYDHKQAEFETKVRSDAQEAITKSTAELAEVQGALHNEESRAKRLTLTAPVEGIISGLAVKAINTVVKPGEPLMEIVPTSEALVVQAEVKPQDIAQVQVGQRADIRVSAFDHAMFGTLEGTVARVSATTFSDPNGRRYYKVLVRLTRDYLANNPKARVMPGMEVEVDVKTGVRSILSYALKPVTRTWETALREP